MNHILFLHRYLVWLEVLLTNIDQSHPGTKELLKKGGLAVARSLIPGALSAVDKTMEETFMKFAKSAGIELLLLLQCFKLKLVLLKTISITKIIFYYSKMYLSRWLCRALLHVRCLPAMVSYNINPGSVLSEDAGDVWPH